jgi:hypothetical protein
MDWETAAILAALAAAGLFAAWLVRLPHDPRMLAENWHPHEPHSPCWTEEVRGPDGLSYGRYGCFHEDLAFQDRRGRRGEFDARA